MPGTPPPPPGVDVRAQRDDPYASFFGTTPVPAPKRTKKRVAVAGAAVVVGALLVAPVVLSGAKSAAATVIDSVNGTLADHTAALTLTVNANVTGGAAGTGGTVTENGTGSIDFTHDALQLQMDVSANSQNVNAQFVYMGGMFYESFPGIDQVVPGKSWVSEDLSSIAPDISQGSGSLTTEGNPADMLRLFAKQGNKVVSLGSSTVDGVAVQGYSVKFSPAALRKEVGGANVPASVRQELSNGNVDMQSTLYIDGSGQLRRLDLRTNLGLGSMGTMALDESLDFSNFGEAVAITAPPSDEVVGLPQFSEAAQAADQGNPTSSA